MNGNELVVQPLCRKRKRLWSKTREEAEPRPRNVVLQDARGHYDILGLSRTANSGQIRAAYRRLALLTHPDKGGRPEDFLKIVNSWEILTDRESRKEYDDHCIAVGSDDGLVVTHSARQCTPAPDFPDPGSPGRKGSAECADLLEERGLARIALMHLLRAHPQAWKDQLREVDLKVLKSLHEYLPSFQRLFKRCGEKRDGGIANEFPREIEPTGWLPDGWKRIEFMYKSGLNKGQTYSRYKNPWGTPPYVQTMKEVIKIEASNQEVDPGPLFDLWRASTNRNNVKTSEKEQGFRKIQKGIYGSGGSYHVNVNFAYFRIYSQRTGRLDRAIEWHISLMEMVEKSKARRQSHIGDEADPLTEEEWGQCLTRVPDIEVTFMSSINKGTFKNIYTPATRDLQQAVSIYHRFMALVNERATSDKIKRQRRMAVGEVRELVNVQRQAISDLERITRELLSGFGISVAELTTPCARFRQGAYRLAASRRPCQPIKAEEPITSEQSSATLKGVKARDCSARVATELQAALGLSNKSAQTLTRHLRTLPAAELARRLEVLTAPFEGIRPVHGILALQRRHAAGPNTTPRRRTQDLALPETPRARERSAKRSRSCDPADGEGGARAASSSSALTPYKDRRDGKSLALSDTREWQPAKQRVSMMYARIFPSCFGNESTPAFFCDGFLPTTDGSACFTISQICRLRTVSISVSHAAYKELQARLRNFAYTREILAPEPRKTRTGRCVLQHVERPSLRLVRFMTHRHRSHMFENIDLRHAPLEALESGELQVSLSKMTCLKHVTSPENGWGTPKQRCNFSHALPSTVMHDRC